MFTLKTLLRCNIDFSAFGCTFPAWQAAHKQSYNNMLTATSNSPVLCFHICYIFWHRAHCCRVHNFLIWLRSKMQQGYPMAVLTGQVRRLRISKKSVVTDYMALVGLRRFEASVVIKSWLEMLLLSPPRRHARQFGSHNIDILWMDGDLTSTLTPWETTVFRWCGPWISPPSLPWGPVGDWTRG